MEISGSKLHQNTIAITDDIVFAQDVLGNLYAVDCESGTLRWKPNCR